MTSTETAKLNDIVSALEESAFNLRVASCVARQKGLAATTDIAIAAEHTEEAIAILKEER